MMLYFPARQNWLTAQVEGGKHFFARPRGTATIMGVDGRLLGEQDQCAVILIRQAEILDATEIVGHA